MENINKDLLPLIAFELNYPDILRFCQVSKELITLYVVTNIFGEVNYI